jgi:hypothetical protein
MRRTPAVLVAVALLAAGCDANEAKKSHEFAQAAKHECTTARSRIASEQAPRLQARTLRHVRAQLAALREPPNTHRAIARVLLAWDASATTLEHLAADAGAKQHADAKLLRKERRRANLAAHLLNVKACIDVVPKR